ncbi:YbjQ family protein [Granulicella aggregans]|uniref:YbjQ family protein n=1 Tax=Granulicella aggregans TaxID=474949 RepID=UPI0021DFD0F2|nr:YbjQ family protein [Granulicella aggregans]
MSASLAAPFSPSMVTTALEIPGFRIVRNYGVVRGIVVRSRSIFGNIGAGLQTLVGGNITIYTDLCEKTRNDAFVMMMQHAAERGGNAVIAVRYDSNEVMNGVTEVLAYGTAVFVEAARVEPV